jgi:hypothetical protein
MKLLIMLKKLKNSITKKRIQIYLWASDCDGMCNHCNEELRKKCFEVKGIVDAEC